jgi:glycosyltransferase involved in cell wall biosynthesis
MNPIKLSVVIITFNEEKNIRRCIDSVQGIADEVIVVDSFSTDKTHLICEEYSVKFHTHAFQGHVQQKNYALKLASSEYVLSLDADEALSSELKDSLLTAKKQVTLDAYSLNRLTNYCGSWIHHCGWYPDRRIRLWRKEKGSWGGENPHDKVIMADKTSIGHLEGDLLHYSFPSISDHIKQLDKFTTISSQEAYKKNKRVVPFIHIVVYPFLTFLKMYLLKLGFMDGYAGFLVCVSGAYYKFLKYAKLNQLQKRSSHAE